jgi:hypothetical protein
MAMEAKTATVTELMLLEQLQAQHTVLQSQPVSLQYVFLIALALVTPRQLLQESTGSLRVTQVAQASST